jgi:hypothetical protein
MAYNGEQMPWRRKKKGKNEAVAVSEPSSQPLVPAPHSATLPPTTITTNQEKKRSPALTDTFKSVIEKAADKSRSELSIEGRIKPMVFFVDADGTMKAVYLSVKDNEYQKESLIRRIQEKALAENISTVIVLTEIDHGHTVVLSGVSPGMRGSACIDYGFDNTTKTVTSWKISWLNQPVQNVLIDGIFDKSG